MENKQEEFTIESFRKKQIDALDDLRSSGPSVNPSSLLMVILQIISILGIIGSIAFIIYLPFVAPNKSLTPSVKDVSQVICGVSIVFFLIILLLARAVRRRNKFIIEMTDFVEKPADSGEPLKDQE